mgnify:CR=1 FL=1
MSIFAINRRKRNEKDKSLKKDHIIVFSTHILELAIDLCDEIVIVNKKNLEIGNQGGCVYFSFANVGLDNYKSNEDTEIAQGAYILEKIVHEEEKNIFMMVNETKYVKNGYFGGIAK